MFVCFFNNKFYSKNLPPQVESTITSNDDQWKALLTEQTIVIDADTFKGLCKQNCFVKNLLMDILVECKVYFTHEAVSVDCEITLQVALKYGEL